MEVLAIPGLDAKIHKTVKPTMECHHTSLTILLVLFTVHVATRFATFLRVCLRQSILLHSLDKSLFFVLHYWFRDWYPITNTMSTRQTWKTTTTTTTKTIFFMGVCLRGSAHRRSERHGPMVETVTE